MALLHAYNFYTGLITALIASPTTVYTVPTGKRIIVRNIQIRNNSGSVSYSAYFRNSGILLYSTVLAAGGTAQTTMWLVMMPGDTIQLAVSNATGANFSVSGSNYDI